VFDRQVVRRNFFSLIRAYENLLYVLLCSVYLRTHPEVAFERARLRARKEESRVTLHYLKKLHDLHEDWLINQTKFSCPAPVSSYFVTVSVYVLIPFPDVLH